MTEKSLSIPRSNSKRIPVWLSFLDPFEDSDTMTISRRVRGTYVTDTLTLKRAVFTGHTVILDSEGRVLAVARTLTEFLDILEKEILVHYDGDLVEEIRVTVSKGNR